MGNLIAFIIRRFGVTPNVARYAAYAVFVLALASLVAATFSLSQCGRNRQRAAQARLDAEQTQAASNSAADAIATQGAVNGRETASEDLTRNNDADIRAADGAAAHVAAGVDAAGRRALCQRKTYKDTPTCKGAKP